MRPRLLPLLLPLLVAALAPAAHAAPDPNPSVPQWVEADLTLALGPITDVAITGTLDVRQFRTGGQTYSAGDIAEAYAGSNRFGASVGAAFVAELEESVRDALADILAAAFPDATERAVTRADVDEASLTAQRVDDYDPPVHVTIAATVKRPISAMGLGDYSLDAVDAVFDVGARVRADFSLSTPAGYATTYRILPPPGLAFEDVAGAQPDGAGGALVVADNARGQSARQADIALRILRPGVETPAEEDVRTTIRLEMGAVDAAQSGMPIATTVETELRAIDAARRLGTALPAAVELPILTADGLRTLHQRGALPEARLAAADARLLALVAEELSEALRAPAAPQGGLSRADLQAAPRAAVGTEPPVRFAATADALYPLEPDAAENLDLALDIGASIRFDLPVAASSTETTYVVVPPPGVAFAEAAGAVLSQDRRSATFTLQPGEAPPPLAFAIHDEGAPVFNAARASLGILVDLKDLEVTLGGVAAGDMGNLLVDVVVRGDVNVLAVPDETKAEFGGLDLAFLASDSVRLLLDRGILTEAQLADLEASLLRQVSDGLAGALGAGVQVTGGFDRASLDPALASDPVSDETPIVFTARASFRQPLSGGSAVPVAAIALYSQTKDFEFPRVEGLDTTYTVVMPRGIAVQDLRVAGGEKATGEADDGRSQFTVRPTEDRASATVTMGVTPTFVLVKFWPVVLGAVLLLVLLVGTPIALVRLRKRNP